MKNNEQKSKPTPDTDKGDYTHHHKRFYWNPNSNSVELLAHWIACRGHHFGYSPEVIE